MLIVMAKLHGSTILVVRGQYLFLCCILRQMCFLRSRFLAQTTVPSAVAATNGAAHEPSERRLGDSTVPSERLPSSVTRLDPR